MVDYRDPQEDPLYGTDNLDVSQNQWLQPPASWSPSELLGANYIGYNNGAAAPLVDSDPSSWLFAGTGLSGEAAIPGVLSNDFQEYEPSAAHPADVEILAHSPVEVESHGPAFADTAYYTCLRVRRESSKAGRPNGSIARIVPRPAGLSGRPHEPTDLERSPCVRPRSGRLSLPWSPTGAVAIAEIGLLNDADVRW